MISNLLRASQMELKSVQVVIYLYKKNVNLVFTELVTDRLSLVVCIYLYSKLYKGPLGHFGNFRDLKWHLFEDFRGKTFIFKD